MAPVLLCVNDNLWHAVRVSPSGTFEISVTGWPTKEAAESAIKGGR